MIRSTVCQLSSIGTLCTLRLLEFVQCPDRDGTPLPDCVAVEWIFLVGGKEINNHTFKQPCPIYLELL